MNLPAVALVGVNEEFGRTITPFVSPPDSPNLHMLLAAADERQKRLYMKPYASGEAHSAIASSEPGAEVAGMTTRAVKDGDHWVIDGRKIWISRVPYADFTIVMALTDPEKCARGSITAFIVEKDTLGFIVEREIPMLGGARTYEVVFENCRVHERQVLGQVGNGFGPMQFRLTVRRLQIGAWCVGTARRALKMIQWWIADGATKVHAYSLIAMDTAAKQDRGEDVRTEASI